MLAGDSNLYFSKTAVANMIPRKSALVIGIDTYPTDPLSVCVHDAVEISAILSMPEYGFQVAHLLNDDATRRNVKTSIDALFRATI